MSLLVLVLLVSVLISSRNYTVFVLVFVILCFSVVDHTVFFSLKLYFLLCSSCVPCLDRSSTPSASFSFMRIGFFWLLPLLRYHLSLPSIPPPLPRPCFPPTHIQFLAFSIDVQGTHLSIHPTLPILPTHHLLPCATDLDSDPMMLFSSLRHTSNPLCFFYPMRLESQVIIFESFFYIVGSAFLSVCHLISHYRTQCKVSFFSFLYPSPSRGFSMSSAM